MWEYDRFVAMRDPRKGGLYMEALSAEITARVQEEISDNCIELIAKDQEHPCACVYAITTGDYVIAMAKKIAGNKKEPRTHEIIRGMIVKKDQLSAFCQEILWQNRMEQIFFPCNTDYDHPEKWELPLVEKTNSESDIALVDEWKGRTAIWFLKALIQIKRRNMKIQLIVDEGAELQTLAMLSCVEELAQAKLFITANGECTLRNPDIVILNQIRYQDKRKYRRMTLEELVDFGKDATGVEEDEEEEDSDEKNINEVLQLCIDYISDEEITEYNLDDAIENLKQMERYLYRSFIRKLRKKLFHFEDLESYFVKRYIKLLYLAYKKMETAHTDPMKIELAPYDFNAMYYFLKKKAKSKRELKRFLVMMLEMQFEECADQFKTYRVHRAIQDIVESDYL